AFAYFVDPEKHVLWLGTSAELDPAPGGVYLIEIAPGSRIRGRYVAVDFPNRIVLEWGIEAEPDPDTPAVVYSVPPGSTTVEITFAPDGDATLVKLVQTGLRDDAAVGFTTFGWTGYLDRLLRIRAGIEPGPDPFSGKR
ncbi:MAG TPA: SRPBCC family protein, partial [Actinomycetota bacterium]|nr:SRPBCC family protein [Actinomycetota bacterium]